MDGQTRKGLAAYYGTRALKQASEHRANNAESFAKAAAHHAFATVGRFKFGRLIEVDGVERFQKYERPQPIKPRRNEYAIGDIPPGLCACEMA